MVDLLKPLLQQDCLFTAGSNDVCEVNSKIGSPEGLHALKIEGKAKAAARKLAGDGAFRFSDTQLDPSKPPTVDSSRRAEPTRHEARSSLSDTNLTSAHP
ncbi:hypothetical protein QF001_001769 [Paraburkholderia youngii]